MEVPKSLMTNKVKRTSKAKLVSVCQQNVSKAVTLNELKFSLRHIINILLTELSRSVWEIFTSVCTHDLGQDSPILQNLQKWQTGLLPGLFEIGL